MSKIAIVTGANKGVGYFIAKQLAETGVKVILACRTETLGKEAEVKLKAEGLDVEYRQLDVSSDASIDSFAASYTADYGKLDILVNNAGIAIVDASKPYGSTGRPTLKTNYYGVLRLSEALLPMLRVAPYPRLVNVASGLGHKALLASDEDRTAYSAEDLTITKLNEFVEKFIDDVEHDRPTIDEALKAKGFPATYAIYSFSKIALIAATRVVARDPANKRVLINAGCPGFCATDLNGNTGTQSPEVGAKTLVHMALLPEDSTVTGRFFENSADSEW